MQKEPEVKGVVTTADGNPLPGTTVVEKGTTNGTITDFDGKFALKVSKQPTVLMFSFIGMSSLEIDYTGQTSLNVVMREDAIGIEEVVAIGYGTQTKREISGSVTNVSEKNFNKGVTLANRNHRLTLPVLIAD